MNKIDEEIKSIKDKLSFICDYELKDINQIICDKKQLKNGRLSGQDL